MLALLLVPVGAALSWGAERLAGRLFLGLAIFVIAWALVGRTWDAAHWGALYERALLALGLPLLGAGIVLTLAGRSARDGSID